MNTFYSPHSGKNEMHDKMRRDAFKKNLTFLTKQAQTLDEVEKNELIQACQKGQISDGAKILIMRALIYNPNIRQHFKTYNLKTMALIELLIRDNLDINRQMKKPINSQIRSCEGDTLMHCAGRTGLRRLMNQLYNAGAGPSLFFTNAHGHTPFESLSNRIEKVKDNNKISKMEKGPILFDLFETRKTCEALERRHTNTLLEKIASDQKEGVAFITDLLKTTSKEGILAGLISAIEHFTHSKERRRNRKRKSAEYICENNAEQQEKRRCGLNNLKAIQGCPAPRVIHTIWSNTGRSQ